MADDGEQGYTRSPCSQPEVRHRLEAKKALAAGNDQPKGFPNASDASELYIYCPELV
jgi:hypothetical protein